MGGKTSKTPATAVTRGASKEEMEITTILARNPDSRELLKYTAATGLYRSVVWDRKAVRKSVLERHLAPLYPGSHEKTKDEMEECPICFLFYPGGLNRSVCCRQGICTECYLQVKPHSTVQAECPFCKRSGYAVMFRGPLSKEERQREEEEQKKVLQIQEKMRQEEERRDQQRQQERRAKEQQQQHQQQLLAQSQPEPTAPVAADLSSAAHADGAGDSEGAAGSPSPLPSPSSSSSPSPSQSASPDATYSPVVALPPALNAAAEEERQVRLAIRLSLLDVRPTGN